MSTDLEIKTRIMEKAREWFTRFGFSKVTMDELAEKLGMSKKTLYKYCPSKDKLVREIVETTLKEIEGSCIRILEAHETDFVDKLKQLMAYIAIQYSKMGKELFEDLERNAPDIWKRIDEFRRRRIREDFGQLFKEGIQKGIFRNDVDLELLLLIYSNTIQNVIKPEVLVHLPFSASQVYEAVIKVFFEGILTEESREKYSTHKQHSV